MHVAVCIVGFRNSEDVLACVRALARASHKDFEIVICENGGESACEETMRALRSLRDLMPLPKVVCESKNPGYAAGVNRCMNETPAADAWWILNPDTLPAPDALELMDARLARGDCDAVGCTLRNGAGQVESRGGRWNPWLARAISLDTGNQVSAPARLSYLSGASMLVGRRFLECAGPMREDYFLYGEEVEWCLRAKAQGARLAVERDAQVQHAQGTTTGSVGSVMQRSRLAVFLDERNKLLIIRDCFPHLLPVATAGSLAMLFMRFARRGAWAQFRYALDGWRNGLLNRRGKPSWVAA
jgi:N-acetylglucosaminyl-diphospho-decaprenol L-rhamnosyltransferase